ncbi:putative F-box protein At5g60060 [Silene latifolia]|uniref:putative F-box protein At5g60060 n=1 Tax=Silene latifolia TaxID=37657 RepID=UPI003D77A93F
MVVTGGSGGGEESKWAEIPTELLIKIAKLCTKSSLSFSGKLLVCRLRAVCKPWRSALPVNHDNNPIPIPIPITPPISSLLTNNHDNSSSLYYLVPSTTCVVQSVKDPSDSHLLIVDHFDSCGGGGGKVFCRKPLFLSYDKSSTWDNTCPKSINLLDYHLSVVAEEHSLRVLIHDDNNGLSFLDSFCKKVVLISNLNPNLKVGEEIDYGVALVLFDGGMLGMYVFYEKKWEMIYKCENSKSERCSDIQRYEEDGHKCVIVIDHKANAFRVNYDFHLRKLEWTKIANEIHGSRLRRKRLVVESDNGSLFLVVQKTSMCEMEEIKMSFNVYLFRKQQQKWDKLRLVPGFILFVGHDFAFTTNSKAFPDVCSGNCIYASKGSFPLYKGSYDFDVGIFFQEIEDSLCVFHFGENCASVICDLPWGGYDYCSIFESPNKWLEFNQPPPISIPQLPLERNHDVQDKSESDNIPGSCGFQPFPEDENAKPLLDLNDHPGKGVPKEKGKRIANDPDLVESTNSSRLPKSRRITLSKSSAQVGNPNSEKDFNKIQSMLKAISALLNFGVAQSDQPGCTLTEVIRELGSLPNSELGSNFSASLLLETKENRKLYVCHDGVDVKDKWLHYTFDRSEM